MPRSAAPPQFATVLRGYDREQVDEYVAALHEFLDAAQDRATGAHGPLESPPGAHAGSAWGEDPVEGATSAARAVHGLPQRVARAVSEALEAAEQAGQAALAEVEHERASLGEQARAVREQARRDAEARVSQAHAEAERLVRDAQARADQHLHESEEQAERQVREASAQAEDILRQGREEDRRAHLAAEEALTSLRQRVEQELGRYERIVRQIEALRQWLDMTSDPANGEVPPSLLGNDPDRARPLTDAVPDAVLDLDEVERERVQRASVQRQEEDEDPEVDQASAQGDRDTDPYGDRTQVLRIFE